MPLDMFTKNVISLFQICAGIEFSGDYYKSCSISTILQYFEFNFKRSFIFREYNSLLKYLQRL